MDEAAARDSEPSHQAVSVASPPPQAVQQPPVGLTPIEYASLAPTIDAYHTYQVGPGRCSSLLSQRIRCPSSFVWSVVCRFDCPQIYKHFIRSCAIIGGGCVQVGCHRELSVISGLPASTSTERLDILDEDRKVTGFTIIGGEHRLRNYKSVTSVNQFEEGGEIWTVVLESYVVDVPEGNSEEDTRLFADTVIKLNLQKLKSVAEAAAAAEESHWSQAVSVASPPPQAVQQPPVGLTPIEYTSLAPTIDAYHTYQVGPGRCSSLLSQRIRCPSSFVWSVVCRFDCPQIYKHFIRSCAIIGGGCVQVGCHRELNVISGLPSSTSTERLDILHENRKVTGFTFIGGEHRLRNYKSVTSVNQFEEGGEIWTVVLESYVVDVPEGNSEEDTRLFADTVIKLNLQKLKSVAEAAAAAEVRDS